MWLDSLTAIVLVGVTLYYAITTHRMLGAMQKQSQLIQGQAAVLREQSQLLAKSAQVTAWAGLVHAPMDAGDPDPRARVKTLALELETLERRLTGQPSSKG